MATIPEKRPQKRSHQAPEKAEVTVGEVTQLATALLRDAGMPEGPAARTAWALVTAEVWGRASHGLLRLPFYLTRFQEGGTDPKAEMRAVSDCGATVSFRGGNGLGHWQLWHAAVVGAERAGRYGVAAVSVGDSGHCGALGLYTLPALEAGMVALVFSNGPAVIPPWGGSSPVTSTSPLAAGIPTRPRPAIVDLASAAVARGKIAEVAAAGGQLPEGWAFDSDGRPTTDPAVALRGMLAPLGGSKGFALAFLVEALTGAVVGPVLAGEVADPLAAGEASKPQRISHLVITLDPRRLDVDGNLGERMDLLAERVCSAGGRVPGAGKPLPGEISPELVLEVPVALLDQLQLRLGPPAGGRR